MNTLSCMLKTCFAYSSCKCQKTHRRAHNSSFMRKFIDDRILSALEKRVSGVKLGFPGSDSLSLWSLCRWLLMTPPIAKSTSSSSLRVKYLLRWCRKSVGGDLKYGSLWTTLELNAEQLLMFVLQLGSAAAFVSVTAPPISPASPRRNSFLSAFAHEHSVRTRPTVGSLCRGWWLHKENAAHPKTPQRIKALILTAPWLDSSLFSTHWSMPGIWRHEKAFVLTLEWSLILSFFFFLCKNFIQRKVFHSAIVACHLCFRADAFDIWYLRELLCRQVDHKNGRIAGV